LAERKREKNPTDRGKTGTKRHILTEAKGIPIAIVVSGAQVHDVKRLEELLKAQLIEKPATLACSIHLCLDAGYIGEDSKLIVERQGMKPHIRPRGEEKAEKQDGKKPRRWVVERTHSWLNRYRRLLIRWEKKERNYLAFVQLACATVVLAHLFPG
jgi:putative transposase